MVALLGLFEQLQVFLQHLLLGEGDAVETGHLRTLFVAAPVGGTYGKHLAGLDGSGAQQMGTTAEVGECALGVGGDMAVLQVVDEFILIVLATFAKELQGVSLADVLADEFFLTLGQFLHLCFNLGKVRLTDDNALRRHHIVIESVFDGRTNAELCTGIKCLQGFSHQVGTRMPEGVLALCILPFVQHNVRILHNGAVQFYRFSIHSAGQYVLCQSLRYALRYLQAGHACLVFAYGAIRKSNLNHIFACNLSFLVSRVQNYIKFIISH